MKILHAAPKRARMEMVPIMDCMFLLLASFVYATMQMTVHRGLNLDLPTASATEIEKQDHVEISVTAANELFLDRTPVAVDALRSALAALLAAKPDLDVRINGDERASHGTIVQVLDAARGAGVKRLGIEARRPQEGGGK